MSARFGHPLALGEVADVALFEDGRAAGREQVAGLATRGHVLLDVGDAWVPPLFAGDALHVHGYLETFRQLARGELGDDYQGHRARLDRYLELYGIPPTLTLLRERFAAVREQPCRRLVPLRGLQGFEGASFDEDEEPEEATAVARLSEPVAVILRRHGATQVESIDTEQLTARERRTVQAYRAGQRFEAGVRIVQARLACDGHLRSEPSGHFDARTRAALAEFERRHRIYSRGRLTGPTLSALQTDPLELERQAVVRVLTERALLTAGLIEDGSAGEGATNLVAQLSERIVAAFGLQSVESTERWLSNLGPLQGHVLAAVELPQLPSYYGPAMPLSVEIDRGDVWFDFPLDAQGEPLEQPVDRRPTLTLFTQHEGRRVALARLPTTIGGWRIERYRGADVWRYKESPVGRRAWAQILSAPVWMPPVSTPAESLITQIRRDEHGELVREVNQNLVGPGYASAYGLVAAYHRRFEARASGTPELGVDEGIRSHGSVDYTSIWRRASHGCHRLHNHLAVRLFTFLLTHRPHRHLGHRPITYRVPVRTADFQGEVRIDRSGYVFELAQPIEVEVLPGRIRGTRRTPSTERIPVASGVLHGDS